MINPYIVWLSTGAKQMPITKSELFRYCHGITKFKNIKFYGSYQKAFAVVLKQAYADKLVKGWNV